MAEHVKLPGPVKIYSLGRKTMYVHITDMLMTGSQNRAELSKYTYNQ